jgi:hypothetical protein
LRELWVCLVKFAFFSLELLSLGLCRSGFYSPAGSSFCSVCPAGTFSEGTSSACSNCPNGQFQNEVGMSACNLCQGSTFQDRNGSATCTPCPFDFTAKEKETLYIKDCRSCYNATSTENSEYLCCNATNPEGIFLNISSIRSEFNTPGILLVGDIENLINSALANSRNIFNLIKIQQDSVAWSKGDSSRKFVNLSIRYGGFQFRFDKYFSEFLGFHGPVPPNGPTLCTNRTQKPISQDGCMSCESDYSLLSPEIPLSLKSRCVPFHAVCFAFI